MITYKTTILSIIALVLLVLACQTSESNKPSTMFATAMTENLLNPFADNNGIYPPDGEYDAPFFKANFDYPTQVNERNYPWQGILNGQALSKENAEVYINAVKQYISDDMHVMLDNPKVWPESSNRRNWYNMAWSGQSYDSTQWAGLETVYGTMTGQVIKNDIFKEYGFEGPMQNHALVFYNDISALTLGQLWKSKSPTGFFPDYTTSAAQFKQNAIVVKAAGTTASGKTARSDYWSVLEKGGTFKIYREMEYGKLKGKGPILQELTWIQFDIIIKDTIASPENGWVFSTFVYDKNLPGDSTFDKMALLGISWGNDPRKMKGNEVLEQTYLNPSAPAYSKAAIGYGARLSGPIDVALVGGIDAEGKKNEVFVLNPENGRTGGENHLHFAASSCFSCHGTASFPAQNDFYPSPNPKHKLVFSDILYNPASREWSNYFQNRSGTEIMPNLTGYKKSKMALDYDLFMQFALNNSLIGQKNLPENIKIPDGYTLWDTEEHGPQIKIRSK